MISTTTARITDYAVIVDGSDNVAVVKTETFDGLELTLPDGRAVRVNASVPPGHRFATEAIPAGAFVRQYGQPIGTSLGIESGDWITHANMSDDVPGVRDLPENLQTPCANYFSEDTRASCLGIRRPDIRV